MTQRIVAAIVLIGLVLAAVLYLPLFSFILLINVVFVLASKELATLRGEKLSSCLLLAITFGLLAQWVAFWSGLGYWSFLFVLGYGSLVPPLLILASALPAGEPRMILTRATTGLLVFYYLALPLAVPTFYHPDVPPFEQGWSQLIFVLLVVWVSDSAAYFGGSFFGKHHVTPKLSPNKTLEGYLAGLVVPAVLAGLLAPLWFSNHSLFTPVPATILAVVIACAGMCGDLFESALKRAARIKDSSNLIPGHGGVLDRIDSLLFALPAHFFVALPAYAFFNEKILQLS